MIKKLLLRHKWEHWRRSISQILSDFRYAVRGVVICNSVKTNFSLIVFFFCAILTRLVKFCLKRGSMRDATVSIRTAQNYFSTNRISFRHVQSEPKIVEGVFFPQTFDSHCDHLSSIHKLIFFTLKLGLNCEMRIHLTNNKNPVI